MSTASPRSKANELWNIVSSSSLAASPHVAVEQIACLIMIKYLDYIGADTTWTSLLNDRDPAQRLSKIAFGNLRDAELFLILNGHFKDAYFQLEAAKPEALAALLRAVEETFDFDHKHPIKSTAHGSAFDHLLDLAAIGGNSLDPTPRNISRAMVSLLDPKPGQHLIDPAAGTARLLLYAARYMSTGSARKRTMPTGIEVDKSVARIAWVNLLLNEADGAQIHYGNSVSGSQNPEGDHDEALRGNQYDFVLSDLPYGNIREDASPERAGYLPASAFGDNEKKLTRRLELLFIWRAIALLKVKGRAAMVISQTVLHGNTRAQRRLRRELLCAHRVEGIILLPFTPNPVALLLFAKATSSAAAVDPQKSMTPHTQSVWFYEVSHDADLYDALAHFRQQSSIIPLPLERGFYYEPLAPTIDNSKAYPADTLVSLAAVEMEGGLSHRHSIHLSRRPSELTKQWRVPVRDWVHKPNWQDKHGNVVGSHDQAHQVRAEYVASVRLYIDEQLQPGLLTANCIEARNWTLDIDEYRWPQSSVVPEGASTEALIDELRAIEMDIIASLDTLRALLGDDQ